MKSKNMAEFRKRTEETTLEGGSCDETTAKKVITLQRAMTKMVVSFLSGKIRGDNVSCRPG